MWVVHLQGRWFLLLYDPEAVGLGGHELGDGPAQRGGRIDMEDGERVLAVLKAPGVQDDRDEVAAGVAEQRVLGGPGHILDIGDGDVADEAVVVVNDSNG